MLVLHIDRNTDTCGENCPFKDASFFDDDNICLLFKEHLMKNDWGDGFYTCESCNKVHVSLLSS
jgi:hypothetical protein